KTALPDGGPSPPVLPARMIKRVDSHPDHGGGGVHHFRGHLLGRRSSVMEQVLARHILVSRSPLLVRWTTGRNQEKLGRSSRKEGSACRHCPFRSAQQELRQRRRARVRLPPIDYVPILAGVVREGGVAHPILGRQGPGDPTDRPANGGPALHAV